MCTSFELGRGTAQPTLPPFLLWENLGLEFLGSLIQTLGKRQLPGSLPTPAIPRQSTRHWMGLSSPPLPHSTCFPSTPLPFRRPILQIGNRPRSQIIFYSALFRGVGRGKGGRAGGGVSSPWQKAVVWWEPS